MALRKERHSDQEYLDAVRMFDPASTAEVAKKVGVARQSADQRLRQLEDEEKVRSKKAGPSLVWMSLVECERCEEMTPRTDLRTIVLTTPMKPVEWDEEAPISDASIHELCSDCAEGWYEKSDSRSFNSFLEDADN